MRSTWEVEALCDDGEIRTGLLGEYHSIIKQWQIGSMLFDEQDLLPKSFQIGEKVALFSSIIDDESNIQTFKQFQNQTLQKELSESNQPFVVATISKILDNWKYQVVSVTSGEKSVYPWTLLSKCDLNFGDSWFYRKKCFFDATM